MANKKEYWNTLLTEKSWAVLQELRKKYSFIIIGGWAAYLLANQQKSKDIDIVVGIKELEKLKKENLRKNDRLKKYELKIDEVDIDIYVEYYSQITIPPEELKHYSIETQGFKVASPEALLALKQGAYTNRQNSVKGEKDKIDIISILFFTEINFAQYKSIITKYRLEGYKEELKKVVNEFKDYNAVNMTPAEFKKKKEKILSEVKRI
jgi:hypothetical protein